MLDFGKPPSRPACLCLLGQIPSEPSHVALAGSLLQRSGHRPGRRQFAG